MVIQYLTKHCDNCRRKCDDDAEDADELEEYSAAAGWTKRPVPNGSTWDLCPECSRKPNNELR